MFLFKYCLLKSTVLICFRKPVSLFIKFNYIFTSCFQRFRLSIGTNVQWAKCYGHVRKVGGCQKIDVFGHLIGVVANTKIIKRTPSSKLNPFAGKLNMLCQMNPRLSRLFGTCSIMKQTFKCCYSNIPVTAAKV